jgi:VWFA-related protein
MLRRLYFALHALLFALPTCAQQPDAPAPKPYVLHAYANLVQVPALALTENFKPLPSIQREQFFLRIDRGPAFHATHMHIEGDEPLSIAILLDASGSQDRLVSALSKALGDLAETSLTPRDQVKLYAADCRLVHSSIDLSPDPDLLRSSLKNILAAYTLHNGKSHGACAHSLRMWDSAAYAIRSLADFPGRRVLLLVSSGDDRKSLYTPATLRHLATSDSVAIFAVRDLQRFQGDFSPGRALPPEIYLGLADKSEDPFTELCESTGGVIMTLYPQSLPEGLQQFVTMLRSRYILEFPRPDEHIIGEHSIDVSIPSQPSIIVTAGVTIALPSAELDADPTTIHSSPSPAVVGKRHVVKP